MAVPGKTAKKKFSASVSLASDEDLNVYCIPCDRTGPRLPAFGFCQDCHEHLCQTCFSHHKKATLSMHHVLLDKGAMPKTVRLTSTPSHLSNPDNLTKSCIKHKKKMIEFYCQDHRVLLCSVCVTLEHTGKSCHVDYIPDISGHVVDSQEFKEILEHMDAIMQHCRKVKEQCKKNTKKSNTSLTEVLNQIQKYRQEINKRIDELENEVESKAKALQKQNNQTLQTTETICDDVTESVNALSDNIKKSNATKQADKLFLELKIAESEMKEYETCINELTTAEGGKTYNFKSNQAISTVLQNQKCLGTLEQKILSTPIQQLNINVLKPQTVQTPTQLQSAENKTNEFSHQGEICVITTNTKKVPWITGLTLLTSDELVIVDRKNNSVKIVNVNGKTIISEIILSSAPWGITSVTSDQLAVTLPGANEINFLSVTSNTLSHSHSLEVAGGCHGIGHYQNKLVVSYLSPAKLEILDMKGTVLTIVRADENVENNFMAPRYVQVNSDSIYVSDSKNETVTKLNWQGKVTGTYGGVGYCQGLALSADETLFVCDWGNKNIVEIPAECRRGKVVIQDVNKPQALCWCDKGRKLYITVQTRTERDAFIQVFSKV